MTDAELLEWLRKPYGDAMMERAADRIEALIAERNDWESHAIYNAEFVDLAVSYRNERDAARAKLAKAVEAAEEMSAAFYSDGNVTERHLRACKAGVKLNATLAEIKGESHE